jgi:DNA-binding NarL/FixJ family response regulator
MRPVMMRRPRPADLPRPLSRAPSLAIHPSVDPHTAFAAGLRRAVDELPTPAYYVDRHRRLRWLNVAGLDLLGKKVGQLFIRVVAPEDVNAARNHLARRMLGDATKDVHVTLIDRAGGRVRTHLVSVPITVEGEIVGIFGLAWGTPGPSRESGRQARPDKDWQLPTPRQLEVLRLLARGLETSEIAARLGVVESTARNHMRGLFRELGVHSRLQAVIRGYQIGLLDIEDLLPRQR